MASPLSGGSETAQFLTQRAQAFFWLNPLAAMPRFIARAATADEVMNEVTAGYITK
jgi:uncharacterized protein with von Willebrand factor type A (vWA) domain